MVALEESTNVVSQYNSKIVDSLKEISDFLVKEKKSNNKIINDLKMYSPIDSEIIYFNVGGTQFSTFKSNLLKKQQKNDSLYKSSSYFKSLVNGLIEVKYTNNKEIFIDRSPKYFDMILSYLRTVNTNEKFKKPKNREVLLDLYEEADYYKLDELKDLIMPIPSSEILNKTQMHEMFDLVQFDKFDEWELIYRGSLHGFGSKDFHSNCDKSSKTLTIVKTTNDYVFGGYTEAQWDSSNSNKPDSNAFIYSFINSDNTPVKINIRDTNNAIYCHVNHGPTFGYKHFGPFYYNQHIERQFDFLISDQSNINSASISMLGTSYNFEKTESFLAGAKNFQVTEIEVYTRI